MEFTLDKLKACISNYYLFDDFQVLACKLSYSIYNTKNRRKTGLSMILLKIEIALVEQTETPKYVSLMCIYQISRIIWVYKTKELLVLHMLGGGKIFFQ